MKTPTKEERDAAAALFQVVNGPGDDGNRHAFDCQNRALTEGWVELVRLLRDKPLTVDVLNAIVGECSEKHQLHPFEVNLSPDYQVTLTLSIREIRGLLIENGKLNGAPSLRPKP